MIREHADGASQPARIVISIADVEIYASSTYEQPEVPRITRIQYYVESKQENNSLRWLLYANLQFIL